MNWTSRRERFRAILSGERCILPACVFDPISARIAEDLGYEAGMLAGSVATRAAFAHSRATSATACRAALSRHNRNSPDATTTAEPITREIVGTSPQTANPRMLAQMSER